MLLEQVKAGQREREGLRAAQQAQESDIERLEEFQQERERERERARSTLEKMVVLREREREEERKRGQQREEEKAAEAQAAALKDLEIACWLSENAPA